MLEPIDDKSAYGDDQLIDFTVTLKEITMEELSKLFKRYFCS